MASIAAAAIVAAAAIGTTAYQAQAAKKRAKKKKKEAEEAAELEAYEAATDIAGSSTKSQQAAINALLEKNRNILGG